MIVTLKESCLRILTIHSGGLFDVGNCPYRLVRPVLFACTPDQLAHIEDGSPRLMLDTDEIWALHVSRNFPNEKVTPPTIRATRPESSQKVEDQKAIEEFELPPNRVIYFETRRAKEEALTFASARLRERVQASRSDQLKRKTIFTGLTDYGTGSKKKKLNGSKSWASCAPAGKTLAERARQQVRKSAAVYANAVRAKSALAVNPKPTPEGQTRTTVSSRPATTTPIFSTRKSERKDSTANCSSHASPSHSLIKVVQVASAVPTTSTNNNNRIIKPTPFPKPRPPQPRLGPLTTPLTRPVAPSKSSQPLRPPPPEVTQLSKKIPKPSVKTPSSLFIPKKLKPPPPQPSKSLIYRSDPAPR